MEDELSEAWERSSVSNSVDQWFCRLWLRCASVNPSQQWVRSGGVWLFRLHYIYLVKRALNCSTQVWKDATLAGINGQHSSDWANITRVHLHKKLIWNTSKSRDANGPRRQNLISELNFLSRRPFHDKKSLMKWYCWAVSPVFLLNSGIWKQDQHKFGRNSQKLGNELQIGCLQMQCFSWYSASKSRPRKPQWQQTCFVSLLLDFLLSNTQVCVFSISCSSWKTRLGSFKLCETISAPIEEEEKSKEQQRRDF